MSRPRVTVLIPNYKTAELTTLCLRLLRLHTDPASIHVIVIDNDSADASLDYLRKLRWIELLERPRVAGESPSQSHAAALDLALAHVSTPYVLSIHTDTLVRRSDWLPFLLGHIVDRPQVAGVGSWKLESKTWLKRWAKRVESRLQTLYYRVARKTDHGLEGVGKNYYYLRSHCALYRVDLIRRFNPSFSEGEETAGKVMHKELVDRQYEMIFLPSEILGRYIDHVNHATMTLNPELVRRATVDKRSLRHLNRRLEAVNADAILANPNLDG